MLRPIVVAIVLACSLAVAGCISGQYAQKARARSAPADTVAVMTKDDVIALARAKVSDDIILAQIKSSDSHFHLSTQDIVDLAKAGVSDKVIDAMIKTDQSSQQA